MPGRPAPPEPQPPERAGRAAPPMPDQPPSGLDQEPGPAGPPGPPLGADHSEPPQVAPVPQSPRSGSPASPQSSRFGSQASPQSSQFGSQASPQSSRFGSQASPQSSRFGSQASPNGPVRRLLSFAIAAFAGLLAVGLIFGAQTAGLGMVGRLPYTTVIFGTQALFVLAFTMALRPPSPLVVGVAGLVTAVAADVAAIVPQQATIALLGYAAAAGFLAAVVGQLFYREGRLRVTESVGASFVIMVGVTAYATLIVLTRLATGTQALTIALTAAGLALIVARLTDTVAPWPRLAPQVPRGSLGVVLGAMVGTAAAAYLGAYLRGFEPNNAALVGLAAAVSAVLADLSVGYAEAGRRIAGEPSTMWVARHLQGPLAGFALAAPLAYLMSALFFAPRYF